METLLSSAQMKKERMRCLPIVSTKVASKRDMVTIVTTKVIDNCALSSGILLAK